MKTGGPNPSLRVVSAREAVEIAQHPYDAEEKLLYYKSLHDIANEIHSARDTDEILISLKGKIVSLFDADRITIYVVDGEQKQIYSKIKDGNDLKEIRLPIKNTSLAGYTATANQVTNISNAYNQPELAEINSNIFFDKSWDARSGYVTKQMLTVPILHKKYLVGVLQLINKKNGDRFTLEDQRSAVEMSKVLGIAFYNQNILSVNKKQKTHFDYLLRNQIISKEKLEAAMKEARSKEKSVESFLISEMRIKKEDVGRSYGEYYGCDYVSFDNRHYIPRELLSGLKLVYLKRNLWVPLSEENGILKVLIDNPYRLDKIDSIKALIPADGYEFAVGLEQDILDFLDYFYGKASRIETDSIGGILETESAPIFEIPEKESGEVPDEEDSAVVRLVNQIIFEGHKRKCSDIHIEPYPGGEDVIVRYRIDGHCHEDQKIPYQFKRAIVSRIKIMADLDISERRKPQDGKIKFGMYSPLDIELRVATLPTAGGMEDVVLRILASNEPMPLGKMGMSDRDHPLLLSMIKKPYGVVLVVGPTGSGKTTTLHSALGHINKPQRKIWTAEDPVEITQRGLRQLQVQPKIGLDFASAMRSFLRADPDVIMIGEMRDRETVSTCIEASLTGHLVFSTLHTNSAPETIVRLIDMGMDPFNFSDALIGILAQRLVRTFCENCKESYHPDREEYDSLVHSYNGNFDSLGIDYNEDLTLYRAKGCEKCAQLGYSGRTSIIELLEGTPKLKSLIHNKAKMEEIRAQAIEDGMRNLMQDGIRKIFLGLTDIQQVRKVCIT